MYHNSIHSGYRFRASMQLYISTIPFPHNAASPPRDATPASRPNVSKHITPHHHQGCPLRSYTTLAPVCSVGGAPVKLDLSLFALCLFQPITTVHCLSAISYSLHTWLLHPRVMWRHSPCPISSIPQPMHAGMFREFFLIFAPTSTTLLFFPCSVQVTSCLGFHFIETSLSLPCL